VETTFLRRPHKETKKKKKRRNPTPAEQHFPKGISLSPYKRGGDEKGGKKEERPSSRREWEKKRGRE